MTDVLQQYLPTIQQLDSTDNDHCKKPMKYESNRLKSYINWPVPFIRPEELSKAGLFYLQVGDLVRCAFCDVELNNWEKGDNPMDDHKRWAVNCPFVNGNQCGNVPMSSEERTNSNSNSSNELNDGYDICGKYGIQIRPNCYPEGGSTAANLSQYTIQLKSASHPQYSTYEERLKSYKGWPISIKQKPDELATAGFFYTGKGDQTVCFYCGGGLNNWESNDVAWEQHARWFSKCSFLRLHKTPEYINKICNEQKAVLTAGEAEALTVPSTSSSNSTSSCNETKSSSEGVEPAADICSKPAAVTAKCADDDDETTKEVPKPTMCKICWTKEVGVVFLPCGHMVSCVDCAPALNKCAVCRRELEATVRAFLS